MSADILRRAAEQARAEAATELSIAPAIERMYGGDDSGTRATARRHAAVADLLDEAALTVEVMGPWDWDYPEGPMDATGSLRPEVRRALAVARAYLGEAS